MGSAQMEAYHAKWLVREAPNLNSSLVQSECLSLPTNDGTCSFSPMPP